MSRSRWVVILLSFVGICLVGCGKDKSPTGGGGDDTTGDGGLQEFPSRVGMLWVFELHDSLLGEIDTVMVSVTDLLASGGDSTMYRWHYSMTRHDTTYTWTKLVTVHEDTVVIRSESSPKSPLSDRFVFPLLYDLGWVGDNEGDTNHVIDTGEVTVKAGSFTGALIETIWSQRYGGGYWTSRTWIVPEVGILNRYFKATYSIGSDQITLVNQTWELIRYDLSTSAVEHWTIDSLVGKSTARSGPPGRLLVGYRAFARLNRPKVHCSSIRGIVRLNCLVEHENTHPEDSVSPGT